MAGPLRPEGLRVLYHLSGRVIPARHCHALAASAPHFAMPARLLSLHICIEFWDNILQAVDDSRGKAGFSIYGPRGRRTAAAVDACTAWNNTSTNPRLDPFLQNFLVFTTDRIISEQGNTPLKGRRLRTSKQSGRIYVRSRIKNNSNGRKRGTKA